MLAFVAVAYFTRNDVRNTVAGPLGALVMLWGFIALLCVVIYWGARIYQRATRDAPDRNFPR